MPDTEAEAIAALAASPREFDTGIAGVKVVALPPMWVSHTHDDEAHSATPRRSKGNIIVRDAEGFVSAVTQRKIGVVTIYADDSALALSAVLNDDQADVPGWRDHVVTLELRKRPEWIHWKSLDGQLVPQVKFAQHIEDGLREIISPAAADMLDLAQTFQATTSAKFKGGQRLKSGERQFVYEEEVDAKGGSGGQLAIPDTFTLSIAPFYGGEPTKVEARLRFQLRGGELALGYKLDRPDDIALEAFQTIVDSVGDRLGVDVIAGVTPAGR